ncbi:hypothetical protein BofuT4_P127180.1 [Botrytis cinerea T4]|uniref:Uncharacterized protein n=1 Tax=Botryotinia fuckeliana (strain T4) TaxID=999810 RepID=G2YSS2_BOTF4|nr:hypothetical protein BofuT4_P127180.1 [Botrytis cinerea T4]
MNLTSHHYEKANQSWQVIQCTSQNIPRHRRSRHQLKKFRATLPSGLNCQLFRGKSPAYHVQGEGWTCEWLAKPKDQ